MNYAIPLAAILTSAAPVAATTQDTISTAFASQEQGATLTQVRDSLEPHAGDDAIEFALGAVDFLLATEQLIQHAHRHGFLSTFNSAARMAGPRAEFLSWIANDRPEPTTAADIDAAMTQWSAALATAEQSLARADGDFTCEINLTAIRFDINADDKTTAAESLRGLFNLFPPNVRWVDGQRQTSSMVPDNLTIAFDRGDAAWLRGYCHLQMAAAQWYLAHDQTDLFDRTGHVFFPKAEIAYDFLPGSTWSLERMTGMPTPAPFDVTDIIALFANMRLPVDEPQRMASALEHLRASVTLGKEMWAHYDRETDNNKEWIPNPNQQAAFAEVEVDVQMRDTWLLFLDEADDILHSRKVLRFWRGDGTKGIDVPSVFLNPHEFDLIYWIQGSAAAPHLKEGEFTTPGTWAQLNAVFNRRIFRYAFWFN